MKIAIAEDDPVTRLLLEEKLKSWGYEVLSFDDGSDVYDRLEELNEVQLFLFDWQMPGMDGVTLCERLKSVRGLNPSYVVILTSRGDIENLVAALESGADDYISKPFIPEELHVRLKVGRRLIETENRLNYHAQHDSLTDTFNHRAILDELDRLWCRSLRDGSPLATLLLDLDHFKTINDNFGHLAGDHALREFSRMVKSIIRPYDSLGRYGGEEFLITLPATHKEDALQIAERIRSSISTMPLEYDGASISMSVSIGVALFSPGQRSHKDMVLIADEAVYEAKETGRNRVVIKSGQQTEGEKDDAIKRLVYISTEADSLTKEEIYQLLQQSRQNNTQNQVTGLLLYRGGKFIQVLEGPERSVDATFLMIVKDKRHIDVSVLLDEQVSERMFADWAMAFNHDENEQIEGISDFLQFGQSRDEARIPEGEVKKLLQRFKLVNKDQ